jgi:Niemann-Pick C1 protein
MKKEYYGPVFRKKFFSEAFKLNNEIMNLTSPSGIRLENICFKPLAPENNNCAVMSAFNYFQVGYFYYFYNLIFRMI